MQWQLLNNCDCVTFHFNCTSRLLESHGTTVKLLFGPKIETQQKCLKIHLQTKDFCASTFWGTIPKRRLSYSIFEELIHHLSIVGAVVVNHIMVKVSPPYNFVLGNGWDGFIYRRAVVGGIHDDGVLVDPKVCVGTEADWWGLMQNSQKSIHLFLHNHHSSESTQYHVCTALSRFLS